ncbi:SusC/RagA family TonB-linked outer membrane protein [Algivirga pacifica]|uniref:SusC/RagA family TonB-linked outer membrane protein n=2 Tax=Algivirga pacifica TaxID=1162670 RepID=A0ABP9D932_9BACT
MISGTVTDGSNPLPGVTVLVTGTTQGTVTNIDGQFNLTVPANAKTIEARFVGYKTIVVPLNGQTKFSIALSEDAVQLQEIVVDGYSTQDMKKMTSTVAVVDAANLQQRPMATFDQALQGQAAGVQVSLNNKAPGSSASVKIRGTGSLAGANQALFIVDGVPVDGRAFATLNPNDFASIQVLKDASAVAIYGSRGANGVVVITTKAGESGKPVINVNSYMGISESTFKGFDMMNSKQRAEFEDLIQDGPTSQPQWYGYMGQEPNTDITSDWFGEFFRQGVTQSHQVSISGGNENSKFYVSGNYYKEDGIVRKTGMERGTLRANLSQKYDRFSMDLKTSLSTAKIDNVYKNDAYNVLTMLPYYSMQDENGEYLPLDYNGSNPFERIDKGELSNQLLGIIASLRLEYELADGLKIWSRTSTNYDQELTKDIVSPNSLYGKNLTPDGKGSLSTTTYMDYRVVGTNALQYNKAFGDHGLNVGVYQEYILENGYNQGFTAYGFADAVTPTLSSPDVQVPVVRGSYDRRQTQLSYFTSMDYDYLGKYILRATYRRDGTSKFGANKRWGNFYTVGAGWVISDEAFLSNASAIDNLKLRASYGTVGNQGAVSRYGSLATLANISYAGMPGVYSNKPANPDLQWETSYQLNTGLDFGFFDGKLTGSANYYNNISEDSFIYKPLPYTSGFSGQTQNAAKLQNQGVELSLNSEWNTVAGFRLNLFANVAYNKSKALELNEEGIENRGYGKLEIDELVNIEGEQLFLAKSINKIGVDPATGRFLFRNEDGSIVDDFTQADKIILGTTEAPWFGGFGATAAWKGLSLSAQFNWEQGATKLNWDRVEIERVYYADQNHSVKLLDSWKEPGDITAYPEAGSFQPFFATTDHWEDASFLRLKNVTLAYELPLTWIKSAGLSKARIYTMAQNMMTWTSFSGIDPEMSAPYQSTNNASTSGGVSNAYPLSKTFTVGLDLTF